MLEEFQPVFPIPKRIETKRLTLRQFDRTDAEEYYDLEQEGLRLHLSEFMPGALSTAPRNADISEMREKIRTTVDRWDDGTEFRFIIREKNNSPIIGQIGITNAIRNVAQSAFIGYWIAHEYLGQGYATEATAAMLGFAFEVIKLHRISIWISTENVASLRVVEKLGLRFEGTALRALHQGGKWTDTHIFAITTEEWNERQHEFQTLYL